MYRAAWKRVQSTRVEASTHPLLSTQVLYIDQPAGTGFSAASAESGYATNQTEVADAFLTFLDNFYEKYPDTRSKELWLTGES